MLISLGATVNKFQNYLMFRIKHDVILYGRKIQKSVKLSFGLRKTEKLGALANDVYICKIK